MSRRIARGLAWISAVALSAGLVACSAQPEAPASPSSAPPDVGRFNGIVRLGEIQGPIETLRGWDGPRAVSLERRG